MQEVYLQKGWEMNRIIKFRGKKQGSSVWVYGDLKHDKGISSTGLYDRITIAGYPVDEKTVGQYWRTVGNQELYDGDIFTVNGKYPKLVRYIPEYAAFCIANIDELGVEWLYPWQVPTLDWFEDFSREILVIGNEFDNPELMKGGSNE